MTEHAIRKGMSRHDLHLLAITKFSIAVVKWCGADVSGFRSSRLHRPQSRRKSKCWFAQRYTTHIIRRHSGHGAPDDDDVKGSGDDLAYNVCHTMAVAWIEENLPATAHHPRISGAIIHDFLQTI